MSKSALVKRTEKAIRAWCEKNSIKLNKAPRHIYPRAYVIGFAAPQCLVVAVPLVDAEPQIKSMNKKVNLGSLDLIHKFEAGITAGDWCSTAYISTSGYGDRVAIKVVE